MSQERASHIQSFFRISFADIVSREKPGFRCIQCDKWFSGVDVAGRRNYFGMVSHISKHVGERLRLEQSA